MTDNRLSLFCLVDGEATSNAFSIKIPSNDTIDDLKDLIKAKIPDTFNGVDAKDLTLWHVSLPVIPANKHKPIAASEIEFKTELDPTDDLNDVFEETPPRKTIHIIVQRPPQVHAPVPARSLTPLPDHLSDESVRKAPPGSPRLAREAFNTVLERLEKDVFHADPSLSRFLPSFVKGDLSIPDADCCVKGLPRTWLRSRTFVEESTQPALYLLHPRRPHQTTTTPPSVTALDTIKKFQNNDMITFFGVSGCGKTRAVVEMLAQNWGFYLNGSQADRGSKDVTTLFESAQEMPARYLSSDRVQNGLNIQAMTCCLLISRLMVLQHCLSLGRHDTFTCDRWMLLQVCPGAFDATVPDVFDIVFRAILRAYHDQTPSLTLPSLKILLQDRFRQVQGQISSFSSDSLTKKLLVVLDEAQTLSDHGRDCFVSRADTRHLRSILSPIIHGLRSISESGRDYCVVTCGTGIGADELEMLASSGGIAANLDQIDHQIVDFPGWETEDQVAMYINNLGDAMSEDDRVRLHTLIPKAAVQELFFKLRGRFRPIITTIEDIIAKGSTSYWSEAIERRLSALVCYPERFPVRGNLCSDIKRMLDKVARDPTKYADAVELKHVLKQTVVHRASLGLPWSLRGEEPILVESAFGRLRIVADKAAAGKTISTIIDEPFVFQAAYNFIKNVDEGFYKHFREQYRDLQDPQSEGKIFERHAPLDLIYAFHKKQLKQELFSIPKAAIHRSTTKLKTPIPQFESVTFPRRFFEHPATIVGWECYEWGARYKETLTMGDFLEAHYKHGSRRGDSTVPPFYYPEASPSGPDIVFVLRIDDQLYPVFVQNKLLNDIFPGDVEEARLTVHETRLKAYLPNLATYCPGGKYLSLIYAHPAIVKTPREGWNSGDLWDSESEIGADHNQVFKDGDMPLMQLLMIIDGSNMRGFVPGGVVDLLDSVKGVKRVHDQLGSSGRTDKKPMLTKKSK
ncbi:hypothetical protein BG003_006268 [Podila horticola]|nr:hypothetical protein BG003_006268 [Podila horticola]